MIWLARILTGKRFIRLRACLGRAIAVVGSVQFLFATCVSPQALTSRTWGPKFATTGASLELKRVGPIGESSSGYSANYTVEVFGFAPSTSVDLWIWRVGKEPQVLASDFKVKGRDLVCDKPPLSAFGQKVTCRGPAQAAEMAISAIQGEPVAVALISHDKKTRVFAKVVPLPFEVVQDTCRISVEREDQGGTLFVATALGLRPNESFNAAMASENELAKLSGKADSNGIWRTMFSPVVKGRSSGTGSIDIQSESCQLHLDYRWGTAKAPN